MSLRRATFPGLGMCVTLLAALAVGLPAPAFAGTTRHEAENATISRGSVESNHAGFSGTGFVNTANAVGSYVEWTVGFRPDQPGVAVPLRFRYANGTSVTRTMELTVNERVIVRGLAFPPTGSWSAWRELAVTGNNFFEGANAVRLTSTTAAGGPNLDFMEVTIEPPAPPRDEAEDATISRGSVASNHAGFSGTGFVNTDNVAGSYVEWTVGFRPGQPGTAVPMRLRFANGSAAARPMLLTVNGRVVAEFEFQPTGSWAAWQELTLTGHAFFEGPNAVRLTSTTAAGGPNLDYLEVIRPT